MHKPLSKLGWMADFTRHHAAFGQLPCADWRHLDNWPQCEYLNQLLAEGARNRVGKPIRFTPQDESLPWPELYYEQRIAQHGIIATRENWHDFFNAMIWCLYPDSKATISELHAAEFEPGATRTRLRDALTLFDENGALIVSSSIELLQAIIEFDWPRVFVAHRLDWHKTARCHVIGHALFEKLLTPYVGITANTLLLHVDKTFFALPANRQRQLIDSKIASTLIARELHTPRNLSPFPVLGVAEWWPEQNAEFFSNSRYFRSKTTDREATILTL